MYIDSPGGDVDAGFAIFDMIRFINAPVYLIGMGLIASAATLVLLAVDKEFRIGLPNSRYLIHQPLGGVQGQASDIEIEAKEIQKFKKELYNIISEHSHTPFEKVWQDSDRNYWMTADEAKEYGMIDNVLKRKK